MDNIVLLTLPYALLLCPQGPITPTNKNPGNVAEILPHSVFLSMKPCLRKPSFWAHEKMYT